MFYNFEKCLATNTLAKLFGPHSPKDKNNETYDSLNLRFNLLIDKVYPIAIFKPKSSGDVQSAVVCGVQTNIQLVPISGGHSYAGLSYGTNDSIIIDFSDMNDISINVSDKVVTVESGTLIGDLYEKLWEKEKFGAPLGSCASVAMGGLAIGGGIGYFSTYYGLVIDNLVEIKMVDARGRAITVNRILNTDLWWAMRGVGPGYIGIVTSLKLKVFDAKDLKITSVMFRFCNRSFKSVMGSYVKWLDWVKENDPKINSVITIRHGHLLL